jgi:large subunit ribosomal protein L22
MKTVATAKFVGTSARKTGLVAALIRGRSALDAQVILRHANKRATVPVGKVLDSAIANAENNHNARPATLVVESVLIGPGPSLKRSRPRAKGSAHAIRKRSSHITVVLSDELARLAPEAKPASRVTKPVGGTKAVAAEQANAGDVNGSKEEKGRVRSPEEATATVPGPADNETKEEAK